jgi:predicted O-methyltransferase YrrM
MGTELMAPLLHSLARSVRAERVLEVGAGLSTLFLLRALAENAADVERERSLLPAKNAGYDPAWARDEEAARRAGPAVVRWLEADPPLADPAWYDRPYAPRLLSVDDGSSPFTTAGAVPEAAQAAGLDRFLDLRRGDFRVVAAELRAAGERVDLAWFDCGGYREYRDFLDLCWDLVEPDGGLLVLHYTVTVPNHERAIAELTAAAARGERGRFEMLSLVEPHKLMQNSCTLVRRCEAPPRRYPLTRAVSLERSGS